MVHSAEPPRKIPNTLSQRVLFFRYANAPDKIKAEIGWYPETMFKEGIKKTIAWFFENEEWMKNVTSGDYQKYYADMYHAE